jgi:hypothetical protein
MRFLAALERESGNRGRIIGSNRWPIRAFPELPLGRGLA